MSIWKTLFNSDTVTKGLEVVDDAFHTDEEKAAYKLELLKAYEAYKVAQRYLAIIFSVPFVLLHTAVFLVKIALGGYLDVSHLEGVTGDINSAFLDPVSIIVLFYFAGGATEGVVRNWGEIRKLKNKAKEKLSQD